MTLVAKRTLVTDVVHWEKSGYNELGEPTVEFPEDLTVRIEKKTKESMQRNNNTVISNISMLVSKRIEIGSLFWIGTLATLDDTPQDLMQVVASKRIPTIKATKYDRWIELISVRDIQIQFTNPNVAYHEVQEAIWQGAGFEPLIFRVRDEYVIHT